MRKTGAMVCTVVVGLLLSAGVTKAADIWGLKVGTPNLKSVGPLAFGPDGILLVGDTKAAAVFAIATGDTSGAPAKVQLNINDLNGKVADLLGASPQDIEIKDMAVNPLSGNLYLSLSKKQGPAEAPALLRIDATGKLSEVSLKKVGFSSVTLPNPVEDKVTGEGRRRRNRRGESITDLAFAEGKVLLSGLTNEASPSNVREIPFPFIAADPGINIEIYHGAHGRYEDDAVVRTFVPFNIGGEPNLLAGFTCTPLVKFPLASLSAGKKTRGTTVAELGNRNRPLDMIVYKKGGKNFLLTANSSRGVMKISTEKIERQEGITKRIGGGGTAGQSFETIEELKGVVQLDRLNDQNAVILVQTDSGSQDLRTVALP
ncbi:MAG: hypothetical protein QGH33_00075 [Pirellulaceae bacterium]|nr:hypothetical protein [Pirellulaceae bacterium]HJN09143.1 hypothetical protein [Pirellulaceae bacterium]